MRSAFGPDHAREVWFGRPTPFKDWSKAIGEGLKEPSL